MGSMWECPLLLCCTYSPKSMTKNRIISTQATRWWGSASAVLLEASSVAKSVITLGLSPRSSWEWQYTLYVVSLLNSLLSDVGTEHVLPSIGWDGGMLQTLWGETWIFCNRQTIPFRLDGRVLHIERNHSQLVASGVRDGQLIDIRSSRVLGGSSFAKW